jgi:uncharacterized protein (TIGR02284 family)
MENEKTIAVLNTLITINNDRIEGYDTAAKETNEHDLKTLFAQLSSTSQHCKTELLNEVSKLDGTAAEGTLVSGKFFRVWMDIKAALTGNDLEAILNSCEFGEDIAKDTYKKALEDDLENLNAEQQAMIKEQFFQLNADHDKVKSMRDLVMDR